MKNDQVTPAETTVIMQTAERCLAVVGDFVELGCYRGDTSVLLGKLLQQHEKTCAAAGKNNELFSTKNPQQDGELSTELMKNSTENTKICTKEAEKSTRFPQKEEGFSTNLSTEQAEFSTNNRKISTESNVLSTDNYKFSTDKSDITPGEAKKLWIYDSFAGLPEKTREDNSGAGANFQAGELLVTKREVVEKIRRAGLRNVIVKKSWFNELTEADLPEQIAFGFLDGDLYESIRVSLKLVAPRLADKGIMIVHDYNNPELPGSSRAVDDFLRQNPTYQLRVQHTLAILQKA